jgi:hypothetical protein
VHTVRPMKKPLYIRRKSRILLLPSLFLCMLFLCHCHVWKAYKSLGDVRKDVEAQPRAEMEESSLYHLDAARGLLDAAEKQYEDADFTAASDLTAQAADQLDRSRKLRAFHKLVDEEGSGGEN